MNLNKNNAVIICEEDYNLLKPYFSKTTQPDNEMSLSAELSRAIVVKNDAFPDHSIRVNSKVKIQDLESNATMEFTIVMPQHANIKEKKISILTPIAAALIGFSQGESVQWKVPAGLKSFKILEVQKP